ncbi:MAG TPA: methyltransferase [Xanthobacteraceae bacterium]|jgi:tRNA1(Val) A37 N6-methylase TrmN6|nr:methyltransferase [Xanthobacteraceae bacterium]
MTAAADSTSEDALLGGKLTLRQPLRGHRFGHDAVLLAAATPARAGEHAIELGAGVGAAGLALARRIEGLAVTLIELDPNLAALARENAARNSLAERVRVVCLDVAAPVAQFADAGLAPDSADHVLMNPPFNAPDNPSPDQSRRLAHAASPGMLARWIDTAARLLRPQGALTLIWRADALADLVAALASGFGAIAIVPVYPKPGSAAIRVLVSAAKHSNAPLSVLPGLVLADPDNKPTVQAEAILRDGAALVLTAR